jgi:hypothetical protein
MKLLQRFFKYFPFSWKCRIVNFLLKRQGIEIKEAKTKEELEQVFHLRWEIYGEEDYIDPDDYPNQRLTDKYDGYSVSFLALKDGEPMGTVRIIQHSNLGTPVENSFNILKFPFVFSRKDTAELSKLCIKKKFRKGVISLGLLKKAFEHSEKREIKYWFIGTTQKLANSFEERLGIFLTSLPVGPPGPKHLEERGIVGRRYFQKFKIRPFVFKIEKIKMT